MEVDETSPVLLEHPGPAAAGMTQLVLSLELAQPPAKRQLEMGILNWDANAVKMWSTRNLSSWTIYGPSNRHTVFLFGLKHAFPKGVKLKLWLIDYNPRFIQPYVFCSFLGSFLCSYVHFASWFVWKDKRMHYNLTGSCFPDDCAIIINKSSCV